MKVIRDYLTINDFASVIFNNEAITLDDLLVNSVKKVLIF